MKKYNLLILFCIILTGCVQQVSETQDEIIYCSIDDECILSTISDDPNLKQFSFTGLKGYGVSAEMINVACISKIYFDKNKEKYNLRTNVWTGSESKCGCVKNQCKEVVYGEPKPECTTDLDCATGGCSGQICGLKEKVKDIITTCEWREEYGCLRLTNCRCINDKCQWEENSAYKNCIDNLKTI